MPCSRTEALTGLLLAACGGSSRPVAAFDPFCGEDEPIRLIEAGPDDHPARGAGQAVVIDRRIVLGFDTLLDGRDEPVVTDSSANRIDATVLRSAGLCGEDPRVVAEGIDWLFPAPWTAAAPLVGCETSSGDVFVLDASGAISPRKMFDDSECVVMAVDGGAVALEPIPIDGQYALIFADDFAAHPIASRRLVERVVAPYVRERQPRLSLASTNDLVLALTADSELVEVDPASGGVVVLRSPVRTFAASPSRRWIVWQEGTASTVSEVSPSTVRLLDRESGEDVYEAVGSIDGIFSSFVSDRAAVISRPDEPRSAVVLLPEIELVELPPGATISSVLPERVVMFFDDSELMGYAIDEGTTWEAPTDFGLWVPFGEDVIFFAPDDDHRDADYWRVELPSGDAQLIASDLSPPVLLSDGRFAGVDTSAGRHYGGLEVVDVAGERSRVDESVFRLLPGPDLQRTAPPDWPFESDVVTWFVHDGDRSGLWAARLE